MSKNELYTIVVLTLRYDKDQHNTITKVSTYNTFTSESAAKFALLADITGAEFQKIQDLYWNNLSEDFKKEFAMLAPKKLINDDSSVTINYSNPKDIDHTISIRYFISKIETMSFKR